MSRYGAFITLLCVILQITTASASFGFSWDAYKKCRCQAYSDVGIAYDDSASNAVNFLNMKKFMSNIVCSFSKVGITGTQFGSYCYSKTIKNHFFLNKFTNTADIKKRILNFPARSGSATFTGLALRYAKDVFFQNDRRNIGPRPVGTSKVLLVITDGKTNGGPDPIAAAAELKMTDVTIVTVGIGPGANQNELKAIASSDYYFFVSSSNQLNAILPQVVGLLCRVSRRGQRGVRGPIGPPGPSGTDGSPGGQGDQGGPGPKGQRGPRGSTGAMGHMGNPGPKGPPGDPGPPGKDGNPGKDGEPGDPGKRGVQGTTGPPGEPGANGQKGDVGPVGMRGKPGDPGKPGEPGTDGEPGVKGPVGYPGDQGEPGNQGMQGDIGDVGDPGDKGPVGPRPEYPTPIKGNRGPPGPYGYPGDKGQKGALQINVVYAGIPRAIKLDPAYEHVINPALDYYIRKYVNEMFQAIKPGYQAY